MPFLAAALPFIIGGGAAAGAIGRGRAAGREREAQHGLSADQVRLMGARFNRETPGIRAGDSVRGDLLAGAQPYKISGEGRNLSSTGGLSPALFSTGTRELGNSMRREAMLSQLRSAGGRGSNYGPGSPMRLENPDIDAALAAPDQGAYASFGMTPQPKAGLLDKILTGAGIAGNVAGMFGGQEQQPNDDFEDIY